ncbi:hypothetical protein BJX76DRAFT_315444 [Aspergillus varians]
MKQLPLSARTSTPMLPIRPCRSLIIALNPTYMHPSIYVKTCLASCKLMDIQPASRVG